MNVMVESIHRENKYCVLMGDVNLDLLKFESHPDTDSFLSTLGTFIFNPKFCSQPELQITLQLLLTTYSLIPLSIL